MEDISLVIENFRGNGDLLMMICDGHGGKAAASFCIQYLPTILTRELAEDTSHVETASRDHTVIALHNSFEMLAAIMRDIEEFATCGTTCALVLITNGDVLYSANVGDTRSLVITPHGSLRVSTDHKVSEVDEYNRIIKSGGCITYSGVPRIHGYAVSRAFGDCEAAPYIIATPSIYKMQLLKSFSIVMCSDGVFDVLSDDDVASVVRACKDGDNAARLIVESALMLNSSDNISVLLAVNCK